MESSPNRAKRNDSKTPLGSPNSGVGHRKSRQHRSNEGVHMRGSSVKVSGKGVSAEKADKIRLSAERVDKVKPKERRSDPQQHHRTGKSKQVAKVRESRESVNEGQKRKSKDGRESRESLPPTSRARGESKESTQAGTKKQSERGATRKGVSREAPTRRKKSVREAKRSAREAKKSTREESTLGEKISMKVTHKSEPVAKKSQLSIRSVAPRTYIQQEYLPEVEPTDLCQKVALACRRADRERAEALEAQTVETGQGNSQDPRYKWADKVMRTNLKWFMREYVRNRPYEPDGATSEAFKSNAFRNRYDDVVCLDATRVVLRNRDVDYIHANWVTLPNGFQYICCQAPMKETSEDFWAMTMQERSTVIVMLCNTWEFGQEKCTQYWPDREEQQETHGVVTVKNLGMPPSGIDDIIHSILEVEMSGQKTVVHHFRWSDWPDHSAPMSPVPLVELLKMTKARCNNRPVVVHCSAGIGRTGTFVGVDYANEKLRTAPETTMLQIFKEIRGFRLQSVQSFLQFTYMHICLLEYLAQINVEEVVMKSSSASTKNM
ncbi:hypothetical protein L596_025275 [Steinernema carpocapsae]|uniref:Tyrosine-protein phosphatase domain-containing protein n=1 Tax=Steinernema carpocapsae TaxID=34508 RepID=A0A4U5M7D3_STECR|nr:hypothetical protein L596_025275 [Steinernema carpocapsae]